MGLPRSTYYDAPVATADEAEIVARIEAICEEFEAYGYRRVGAALRHQGIIVNSKKVRRLMREHDLQPRRRKKLGGPDRSRTGVHGFAIRWIATLPPGLLGTPSLACVLEPSPVRAYQTILQVSRN